MCVNKIKLAVKKTVKFLCDNTNIDYHIAKRCIQYVTNLYGKLDPVEKSNLISYLAETLTIFKANFASIDESKKGGEHE